MNIYALLSSFPTVTALVASRITPVLLDLQPTFPAITYQIVGGNNTPTLTTTGWHRLRVQINCLSKDYASADAVRQAVIAALNGYSGTVAGTKISPARLLFSADYYEDELEVYRLSADFYFTILS